MTKTENVVWEEIKALFSPKRLEAFTESENRLLRKELQGAYEKEYVDFQIKLKELIKYAVKEKYSKDERSIAERKEHFFGRHFSKLPVLIPLEERLSDDNYFSEDNLDATINYLVWHETHFIETCDVFGIDMRAIPSKDSQNKQELRATLRSLKNFLGAYITSQKSPITSTSRHRTPLEIYQVQRMIVIPAEDGDLLGQKIPERIKQRIGRELCAIGDKYHLNVSEEGDKVIFRFQEGQVQYEFEYSRSYGEPKLITTEELSLEELRAKYLDWTPEGMVITLNRGEFIMDVSLDDFEFRNLPRLLEKHILEIFLRDGISDLSSTLQWRSGVEPEAKSNCQDYKISRERAIQRLINTFYMCPLDLQINLKHKPGGKEDAAIFITSTKGEKPIFLAKGHYYLDRSMANTSVADAYAFRTSP